MARPARRPRTWAGRYLRAARSDRGGRPLRRATDRPAVPDRSCAVWLREACAVAGRDLTRAEWDRYLPGRPTSRPAATRAEAARLPPPAGRQGAAAGTGWDQQSERGTRTATYPCEEQRAARPWLVSDRRRSAGMGGGRVASNGMARPDRRWRPVRRRRRGEDGEEGGAAAEGERDMAGVSWVAVPGWSRRRSQALPERLPFGSERLWPGCAGEGSPVVTAARLPSRHAHRGPRTAGGPDRGTCAGRRCRARRNACSWPSWPRGRPGWSAPTGSRRRSGTATRRPRRASRCRPTSCGCAARSSPTGRRARRAGTSSAGARATRWRWSGRPSTRSGSVTSRPGVTPGWPRGRGGRAGRSRCCRRRCGGGALRRLAGRAVRRDRATPAGRRSGGAPSTASWRPVWRWAGTPRCCRARAALTARTRSGRTGGGCSCWRSTGPVGAADALAAGRRARALLAEELGSIRARGCGRWRRRSWRRTRRWTGRPRRPNRVPVRPGAAGGRVPVQGPGRLPGGGRGAVPRPPSARRPAWWAASSTRRSSWSPDPAVPASPRSCGRPGSRAGRGGDPRQRRVAAGRHHPGGRPVDALAALTGTTPPDAPVVLVSTSSRSCGLGSPRRADRLPRRRLGLLDDGIVVRCVAVVRGDHVGRLAEHAAFAERLGGRSSSCPPSPIPSCARSCAKPARTVGLDRRRRAARRGRGRRLGRPGALPLLSTALVGT